MKITALLIAVCSMCVDCRSLRGADAAEKSCAKWIEGMAEKMVTAQTNPAWKSSSGIKAAKELLLEGKLALPAENSESFIRDLVKPADPTSFEGMFWEFPRQFELMTNLANVTSKANKYLDFTTVFGRMAGIDHVTRKASDDFSLGVCGKQTDNFNDFWATFSDAFSLMTMQQHKTRYFKNGLWTKPVTVLVNAEIYETADAPAFAQTYFVANEVKTMVAWGQETKTPIPPVLLLNLQDNCADLTAAITEAYPSVPVDCKKCEGGDWASCTALATVAGAV